MMGGWGGECAKTLWQRTLVITNIRVCSPFPGRITGLGLQSPEVGQGHITES